MELTLAGILMLLISRAEVGNLPRVKYYQVTYLKQGKSYLISRAEAVSSGWISARQLPEREV